MKVKKENLKSCFDPEKGFKGNSFSLLCFEHMSSRDQDMEQHPVFLPLLDSVLFSFLEDEKTKSDTRYEVELWGIIMLFI